MKTENFHEMANDAWDTYKGNIAKSQKTNKNLFILGYESAIMEHSKEIHELQHHKDTTVGLYAFDCKPELLLEKFNNSQSDAHSLVCEDFEQLNKDWIKYCNDENVIKSPFFRITF